eukprot:scaffold44104_cov23-Cyclotella_meneghiniana.AAC.1
MLMLMQILAPPSIEYGTDAQKEAIKKFSEKYTNVCRNCGGIGHWKSECPTNPKNVRKNEGSGAHHPSFEPPEVLTKKTEAVPERVGNMVTFHPVINEKVCGELVNQAQDGQEDEVIDKEKQEEVGKEYYTSHRGEELGTIGMAKMSFGDEPPLFSVDKAPADAPSLFLPTYKDSSDEESDEEDPTVVEGAGDLEGDNAEEVVLQADNTDYEDPDDEGEAVFEFEAVEDADDRKKDGDFFLTQPEDLEPLSSLKNRRNPKRKVRKSTGSCGGSKGMNAKKAKKEAKSTKSTATSKTVKSQKPKTEAFIDLEEMPVGEVQNTDTGEAELFPDIVYFKGKGDTQFMKYVKREQANMKKMRCVYRCSAYKSKGCKITLGEHTAGCYADNGQCEHEEGELINGSTAFDVKEEMRRRIRNRCLDNLSKSPLQVWKEIRDEMFVEYDGFRNCINMPTNKQVRR